MNEKKEIEICAVGDISLGDHYLCAGFGVRSKLLNHDHTYLYKNITDELSKSGINFGNLECVLSNCDLNKKSLKKFHMRGRPESVNGLKMAGFNVLSMANNHIMQHGKEAVVDTARLLKKNDISCCGIKNAHDCNDDVLIMEVSGTRICFLAYNDRPRKYFSGEPIYREFDLKEALEDVRTYKNKADIIILSIHWGDEYIHRPSIEQIKTAHTLVDNGVDIILGHHPHVVQGIEEYKSALIFYSLGNFIFDMPWNATARKSVIAKIRIEKNTNKKSYELVPIWINDNYQPVKMTENEQKKYISKINDSSKYIKNHNGQNNCRIEYQNTLKLNSAEERRLSHRFWLDNIFKYPYVFLFQYVLEIMLRRFNAIRNLWGVKT